MACEKPVLALHVLLAACRTAWTQLLSKIWNLTHSSNSQKSGGQHKNIFSHLILHFSKVRCRTIWTEILIKQLNLTHSCESWNAGGQFKKSVLRFHGNVFGIRSDNVQIYEFLNLLALLVQEYFQEVILNKNCSNLQIRRRPHSWCWWVSPLPLSVNRVKREQVSIMCSVQKKKQSHIWHHYVPRLRLIIKNYLKDHNVKCIAAA